MSVRTGFYICHCGINIAYKVRVNEVADFARKLPGVAVARDYKFMCSDPGQEMIEKDIKEYGLTRVVVASCSPRLHEKTFQGVCRRAGLNPFMFQMASVREQVSWVTRDEDEATRKAKTLVAGAINRVQFHRRLETREVSVHPDVLVVGGGIAGMQAALDIGNAGHTVYLAERETTIGGHMLQFDKTFPTLDCAACIGTPKMVDVAQNPKIELLSHSEVREVSGHIGNYTVKIRRKPRYVKEGVCTGCGECAKACPVSAASEWDEGLGERKAIFRAFPQAVPITFCIDKKDRAPCVRACPAGVNVQGYVQLIREGKYETACRLIMEKLPFPGVLGRVCPHPCESECRRDEIDDAIAIRDLKRFVSDCVDMEALPVPEIEERREKVAVIGAGPAGLTVASDLRREGYQVTIFEALPELGGMLRVGIPDYRLPPEILDREIGYILRMGAEARTGVRFGMDFTPDDLEKEGFSAVFIGVGAHNSLRMGIPGEDDTEGVIDAVRFLREVNLNSNFEIRDLKFEKVVVIGGGNVAIDAARVAKRLGARNIEVVYRRSDREMPAYPEEIQGATEEGISFSYLTAPVRIIEKEGNVAGLECLRTELGPSDASGRRRPVPVQGSEFVISCDVIIPAIGQRTDSFWAEQMPDLKWSSRGTMQVNPRTMQTAIPHLFAGGDAVSGPATVIEAVAAGHKAAFGIHQYLETGNSILNTRYSILDTRYSILDTRNLGPETRGSGLAADSRYREMPDDSVPHPREVLPLTDPEVRVSSFKEAALGFTEAQAVKEAGRCLNCGMCCECMECVRVCEANAIDHAMKEEEIEVKVGSIILATGYDLLNPAPMKQYGYGVYPNVFTSLEFERLSNATGPTGGEILIRDGNGEFVRPPESVAILHCIGSRDVNYHEYCSRVCCMYALKYSHLIKEKVGHDTKVYSFYIDMRCFGEGYEEFYRRCQEEGTIFIRGKAAEITDRPVSPEEKGKLVVIGEDTLLGMRLRVPVDMVILCAAMEARGDAAEVGRIFGVNQGADGFFLEEHPKLAPLNTATDGVFLAGACQAPRDIPDTVSQASGAAAKALSLAVRGKVQVPSTISRIDPDICAGCQTCIGLCPYSAIEFDERRRVSVVNEAVCKGCGSCSGVCPSGAAQIGHFMGRQIFAELDGIMDALYEVGNYNVC
ncbi:FAD-dependent oxidoreductase [Desulfobacterales bacterium HSG2]|nr:FAD-dependent oxidoreductase [Desulfobacterales bacterium HSG2]